MFLRHRAKGPYDRVDGGGGNGSGEALDENADGREIEYNVSTKSNIHCSGIRGIEGFKLSAQRQIGIREYWANSLYQGREILRDFEAEEGIHEEKVIWLFCSRLRFSLDASVAAHLSGPAQKIKEGKDGAENVSFIIEAVKEGGMLTCQALLLHTWLPWDILLGDHQPRHLRPHGG